MNVELGKTKMKDVITGYKGIITARTERLDGRIQFLVEKINYNGKIVAHWFDSDRLMVIGEDK